jgi:predicted nucleic acid-binding protein
MKIVVDANIVFSAILNSNSKIGDLLIQTESSFNCAGILRYEIKEKHQSISQLSIEKIMEAEDQVCKDIIFL